MLRDVVRPMERDVGLLLLLSKGKGRVPEVEVLPSPRLLPLGDWGRELGPRGGRDVWRRGVSRRLLWGLLGLRLGSLEFSVSLARSFSTSESR